MSASTNSTHSGTYQGFEDILEFFNLSRKQCPKGVRIKRNRGTIQLDITTDPETGGVNNGDVIVSSLLRVSVRPLIRPG